jgi:predicted HicB family RNase H-like nuclease
MRLASRWFESRVVSSPVPGSSPRSKRTGDLIQIKIPMKYKGYTGVVEFDEDSGTLFGHVIGLRDGITFQGDSVAELIQAFHDSVDDYLEFCAGRGESPEKPFSGQFVLRIDPQLHRTMSHAAEERGVSLNSLVEEELKAVFLSPARGSHGQHSQGRASRGRKVGESGSPRRRRAGGA